MAEKTPEEKITELLEAEPSEELDEFGDPIGFDKADAEIVSLLEQKPISALLEREPRNNRERDLIGVALRKKVMAGVSITVEQYDEMRSRGLNIPLTYKPAVPVRAPKKPKKEG